MSPLSNRLDYSQNSIQDQNDSNKNNYISKLTPTHSVLTKDFSHPYPNPKSVIYPNGNLDDNVEDRISSIFASLSHIQTTLAIKGREMAMDKREKMDGAVEKCMA